MSGKLTLDTVAGGSVTLTVDDTETGDIEYALDSAGIDNGSNVNGRYTKFPDGTLICIDEISGGQRWTFPESFIGNPTVTATAGNTTSTTGVDRVASIYNVTEYGVDIHVGITTTGGPSTQLAYVIAIGRWK